MGWQTYERIIAYLQKPSGIYEGYFRGGYTNISPAKAAPEEQFGYLCNWEEMISVSDSDITDYLLALLDKYYLHDLQIIRNRDFDAYDKYGWNCYTVEQMQQLLVDLKTFTDIAEADPFDIRCLPYFKWWRNDIPTTEEQRDEYIRMRAKYDTDFYRRFHARMTRMLENRKDFDLIMFEGP